MKLSRLLKELPEARVLTCADRDPEIRGLSIDSRQVEPGFLFVAIPGHKRDGQTFIAEAVKRYAAAVIVRDGGYASTHVPSVQVADPFACLSVLSNTFFDAPSGKLDCLGITGTNGKTTTAYLIESILNYSGRRTGLIGTIEYRTGQRVMTSSLTTPQAHDLNRLLAEMAEADCRYCAMEVSSHSLALGRVDGMEFRAGLFTNLSQDHLDYHKDMESYFEAKSRLFDLLAKDRDPFAVVDVSGEWGRKMASRIKAPVIACGLDKSCEVWADGIRSDARETTCTVHVPGGSMRIWSALRGEVNVHNIMLAAACCLRLGVDKEAVTGGIAALTGVPGRMEFIPSPRGVSVVVDFAHTPEALRKLLEGVRELAAARVIAVFGCGGERDALKRPIMGRMALELSDVVIVTNDNPRREDPDRIIEDIVGGDRGKFIIEKDRRAAIRKALEIAQTGDIVVVAGKGHENYQILGEKTVHFSDKEVCEELLRGEPSSFAGGKRP